MSQPNDRNYQLKLIYNDEDLRKPRHDEIMHWLDAKLRDPAFTEAHVISPRFRSAFDHYVDDVVEVDGEAIKPDRPGYQYLCEEARRAHPAPARGARTLKPEEGEPPIRRHSWVKNVWEQPLQSTGYGGRKQVVGFLDLAASFNADAKLVRVHHRRFAAKNAPNGYGQSFELLEETAEWTRWEETLQVGFEVKSEISSVGELMRQLQLYRTTESIHQYRRIIVVAPAHPDAENVLRSHGFGFIASPDKASGLST